MVAELGAKATPDPARPMPPIRFIDQRSDRGRGYHIVLMIIPVLTALAALASVPEPIKVVGEFLLGLLLFIGLMGRP